MKSKIIQLIIILLSITVSTIAQNCPESGDDLSNPNLDKFEGTWKYSNGTTELIVKLKKVHYYFNNNLQYSDDVILGGYMLINNGTIIQNYLFNFNQLGQNLRGSIFTWGNCDLSDPDHITGSLKDEPKNKAVNLMIGFLPDSPDRITWRMQNKQRFVLISPQTGGILTPPFDETFTLPNQITLSRQP